MWVTILFYATFALTTTGAGWKSPGRLIGRLSGFGPHNPDWIITVAHSNFSTTLLGLFSVA